MIVKQLQVSILKTVVGFEMLTNALSIFVKNLQYVNTNCKNKIIHTTVFVLIFLTNSPQFYMHA